LIEVDLKNKPEDLTRKNPYGKVPVLVDGDGIIYESAIIDEYLEEKFPQVRLMPTDLLLRAKARIWIDYFSTRLHAAASDITHNRNPEKAQQQLQQHLTDLDREMADKNYLVDNQYSLADVTFIPFYTRRERYHVSIDANYPNLKRWAEKLVVRPQVAATL
jgi:glutathione S-transferase